MTKTRVVVLYGGRSTEHEVSCRSAAFVLKNLDRNKYDVQAIAIDKSGRWLPQSTDALLEAVALGEKFVPILPPLAIGKNIAPNSSVVDPVESLKQATVGYAVTSTSGASIGETVVFPVLHGTYGEDGSVQGFFDLADVAYVGPGVLGSAIGMDKVVPQ